MSANNMQFEMAQALRKSHCDRKNEPHECVGEVTIKRGEVCLNCAICGKGEEMDGFSSILRLELDPIFYAAGIRFDSLALDVQCAAIKAYRHQLKIRGILAP